MIKVLIVDDSTISRELLTEILSSDTELEVVATASNGQDAVALAKKHRPDLITMDIHMPRMNGFEAIKEIMIEQPTPIVVVSASTAVTEVEWAMEPLNSGTLTLKLKPPGPDAPDFDYVARDLIETVKAMAEVKVLRHHRPRKALPLASMPAPNPPESSYEAIAIAASTGGPPALSQLLGELPASFPIPILLVQHIAGSFVDGFASWLDSTIELSARVAEDGEFTQPGTVYVAPRNRHLSLTPGMRVALSDEPATSGFRPSANHLFQKCAQVLGSRCIGIVLTGMGNDGVEGLAALHAKGGLTIVQNEETSIVFGMPGAAVAVGVADAILPIEKIAGHLTSLVYNRK